MRAHICPANTYSVPGTVLYILTRLSLTTTSQAMLRKLSRSLTAVGDTKGNPGTDQKDADQGGETTRQDLQCLREVRKGVPGSEA